MVNGETRQYNLRSRQKKELEIESDYKSIITDYYTVAKIRYAQCNVSIKFIDEYEVLDVKATLDVQGLLKWQDTANAEGRIFFELEKRYAAVLTELASFRQRFEKEKESLERAIREPFREVTRSELALMAEKDRKDIVKKWKDEVKAIFDWIPQLGQLSMDWENAKDRLQKEIGCLEKVQTDLGININHANSA